MTILPHSLLVAAQPSRRWSAFARHAVSVASVLADAAVIVSLCVAVGWIYHRVVYGEVEPLRSFASVGLMAAGLFVLPGIVRGEYDLAHYLDLQAAPAAHASPTGTSPSSRCSRSRS